MPATPWKSHATVDSNGEYLVLGSYLQLQRFSAPIGFARGAVGRRKHLARAKGLLGYSMVAGLWARQYFTLSVWEDEPALHTYVSEHPHFDIMSAIAPDMRTTRFVRWQVHGSALPPAWPEALRGIEDAGESS